MRFSTRGLLGLVLFIALAIAALKFGSVLASMFVTTVVVVSLAAAITVLVASEVRRAFSIGFLVPVVAYCMLHYLSDANELDYYDDNTLPTTKAFQPLHEVVNRREYFDVDTGETLPNYVPDGTSAARYANRSIGSHDHPHRETFVLTAHSLVAVISGIAGGVFAVCIRGQKGSGEQ